MRIGEPGRAPEATGRNSAMRVVRAAAAAALLCAGLAACSSGGAASGSGSGSGSSASNSPVSAQVAATSQDVSFTVDGTKTYGTLEIPAHRGGQHLAAALLLAGSGPTDRDGDQPSQKVTPQTLKLVAEQLDSAVQQGQLSAPAAQQQAEGINNAIAQFRAGRQVDTSGLLPQIVQQLAPELLTPGNAKAARTNDEVSPVEAAAKVGAGTR